MPLIWTTIPVAMTDVDAPVSTTLMNYIKEDLDWLKGTLSDGAAAVVLMKAAEAAKLRKERERLVKDIESKRARLADAAFRSKAPEHVVRGMESALAEREAELRKLADRLAQLERQAGTGASA